jgi:hypothetical protein
MAVGHCNLCMLRANFEISLRAGENWETVQYLALMTVAFCPVDEAFCVSGRLLRGTG